MCDEYEQKTQRLKVLHHKIEEVKKKHGEYAMSGETHHYSIVAMEAGEPHKLSSEASV